MPPAIVAVSVDNSFATTDDVDTIAVEDNDVDFAAVVIAAVKTLGTAFSCVIVVVDDDDAILKPRFVVFIAAEEEDDEDDDATNARRSLCDTERWNAFIGLL
jgi:hypothetical protein